MLIGQVIALSYVSSIFRGFGLALVGLAALGDQKLTPAIKPKICPRRKQPLEKPLEKPTTGRNCPRINISFLSATTVGHLPYRPHPLACHAANTSSPATTRVGEIEQQRIGATDVLLLPMYPCLEHRRSHGFLVLQLGVF